MKDKRLIDERFQTALETRLREEYMRGYSDGLGVAKTIRGWLTQHPDRKWQKQVREWADKAIAKAERECWQEYATR